MGREDKHLLCPWDAAPGSSRAPEPTMVDMSAGSTSTPQPEPVLQKVHPQTPRRHRQATGIPGLAAQCPHFLFHIILVIGMCAE